MILMMMMMMMWEDNCGIVSMMIILKIVYMNFVCKDENLTTLNKKNGNYPRIPFDYPPSR